MIEPLPEALRALITAEGTAPVVSEVAQVAVRAKLGATLGIKAAATATATTTTTAAATTTAGAAVKIGTILKILVVTVGVGTATTAVVATRGSRTAQRATTAPVIDIAAAPARDADTQPDPVREVATDAAPVVEASAAPAATRAPAPRAVAVPEPSQAKLLADATRAFSVGDAALALQLLDADERHHAQGPLGEERDALRVSVLVALGRSADARARSRELLARYPNTIHRALLERVLKETP